MRRAAAFLVLVVFGWLFTGAVGAGAGQPQKMFSMPVDETNMLAECDGFQVMDHVVGELSVTGWIGKDGTIERFVTETKGQHHISSTAGGTAVISSYNRRWTTDFAAGRTRIVGPAFHVAVPGHGMLVLDTGAITVENGTFTRHGPQAIGDSQAICAAFA